MREKKRQRREGERERVREERRGERERERKKERERERSKYRKYNSTGYIISKILSVSKSVFDIGLAGTNRRQHNNYTSMFNNIQNMFTGGKY